MSVEHSHEPTPKSASTTNWPIIIWALYLGSFVTIGLTMLIGAGLAYLKRPQLAGTPAWSHMTYAIWTFLGTTAITIFGIAAPFDLAGMVFGPLLLWQLVRIVRGFLRAVDRRPIDRPYGLF